MRRSICKSECAGFSLSALDHVVYMCVCQSFASMTNDTFAFM
jgi:hypothetical protein